MSRYKLKQCQKTIKLITRRTYVHVGNILEYTHACGQNRTNFIEGVSVGGTCYINQRLPSRDRVVDLLRQEMSKAFHTPGTATDNHELLATVLKKMHANISNFDAGITHRNSGDIIQDHSDNSVPFSIIGDVITSKE